MGSAKDELASRYLYDVRRGKDKEREIVSGFVRRLQLDVSLTASERPDFLATSADGLLRIGIELTSLNADGASPIGSPERRLYALWKRFAEAIRERLSSEPEPLPHVYGSISFRNSSVTALDDIDRARFCEELVSVLREATLSEKGSQLSAFERGGAPLLSQVVSGMFVRIFPADDGLLWWCSHLRSGEVLPIEDAIRSAVAEKQQKARTFEWQNTSERWLLLYAAGESLVDLAIKVKDPGIGCSGPFTQIFLWDRFSECIYCVSPTFAMVVEDGATLYLRQLPASIWPHLIDTDCKTTQNT